MAIRSSTEPIAQQVTQHDLSDDGHWAGGLESGSALQALLLAGPDFPDPSIQKTSDQNYV